MRYAFALLLLAASSAFAALPPNVELVETFRGVTQYRLKSNGMPILLVPQRASPVFTFMVVYHVGSRNEAPGTTGSTHLLEHLIAAKSTENFGVAKGHKTFWEVLYAAGAVPGSTNMTVRPDRMTGFSTLPSDKLELAMRIEADRLGRALILDSERQSEMPVVRNELEIGENQPWLVLQKAVIAASVQAHSYHWHPIGYRSDIEGVSTAQLREHYKTYFWPNNAHAILVGDFETDEALALFDREFGSFARSPHEIPKVITVEPPQEGERRTVVQRPGTVGIVTLGYIRPAVSHPDFVALDVLRWILVEGVNSRLNRALVEQGLATNVYVWNPAYKDPHPTIISANVAPRRGHAEAEAAIKAVIAEVAANGVTDDEVRRAQQLIEVAAMRTRDGPHSFALELGEAVASADWKWLLTYVDNVKAVTAADVKRVAATHFVPHHATVGWFVPTANVAKAAPPLVENRAVPTVAVRALVMAGQARAGKPALPELTARMLTRGTLTRSKEEIGDRLANVGSRTILAIVGDIDAARTLALVEKHFESVPRGEPLALMQLPRTAVRADVSREAVTMRGKANMNVVLGAASGLRRGDPDYEAALVGNAALGQMTLASRIGRRVRDTDGLTYGVISRFEDSDELDGVWFVNVSVAPQNMARALKSTREVIDEYARDGATDAEVEANKSFFAGNFQVELGSNGGIAQALVTAERFGFGPRYLDDFPARIKAVTTAQANAAMRKYFYADKLHVVVAGDIETLPD